MAGTQGAPGKWEGDEVKRVAAARARGPAWRSARVCSQRSEAEGQNARGLGVGWALAEPAFL